MILDLAHASQRTFFEVLERAPDAPVVVSHACCRAVFDTPRNLSDDQLRALADHGGVLAVMGIPLAVDLRRPSLERVVDHIDHAVDGHGRRPRRASAPTSWRRSSSRGAEPAVQATSLMPDGMSFADPVPGFQRARRLPGAGRGHGRLAATGRRARPRSWAATCCGSSGGASPWHRIDDRRRTVLRGQGGRHD